MNGLAKNAQTTGKPLILVAPLDWGLGHTTRIIPLIRYWHSQGIGIVTACNSIQKALLAAECPPGISFLDLPGYNIGYGRSNWRTRLRLLLQVGNILTKVKLEHHWLEDLLLKRPDITSVVSDNRYGLYSSRVPCFLITHQLAPRTGWGQLADRMARNRIHRWAIRFTECWVPDQRELLLDKGPGGGGQDSIRIPGLSGALSHGYEYSNIRIRYIGVLSRLEDCPGEEGPESAEILILLSGPEPQRSIFENIILKALRNRTGCERLTSLQRPFRFTLVRGLPERHAAEKDRTAADTSAMPEDSSLRIFDHLPAAQLQRLICRAQYVVCRPGYSSVMDLLKLRKQMIVVPTPGQGEQAYLARYLQGQGLVLNIPQEAFDLFEALQQAARFNYARPEIEAEQYRHQTMEALAPIVSPPAG